MIAAKRDEDKARSEVQTGLLVADAIRAIAWRGAFPEDRLAVWAIAFRGVALLGAELIVEGSHLEASLRPAEAFALPVRLDADGVIFIRTDPGGGRTLGGGGWVALWRLRAAGDVLGISIIDFVALGADGLSSARQAGLVGPNAELVRIHRWKDLGEHIPLCTCSPEYIVHRKRRRKALALTV